jgi:hypothetical protein
VRLLFNDECSSVCATKYVNAISMNANSQMLNACGSKARGDFSVVSLRNPFNVQ